MERFSVVLDLITRNQDVPAEDLADLVLFVGEGDSTPTQRAGVMTALCMRYKERFKT